MSSPQPPLASYRRAEFRTRRYRIRPALTQDQPLMFGWRSDLDTSRFLSGAAPESIEQQLQWFEGVRDDASYSYHIVEDEGVPVGFTSMFNADAAAADAEWGLVIGRQDRTPGDVRVIAPLCCKCVFEYGGLDAIYTCINESNSGAIRRVEQLGAELFTGPSSYHKQGEILFRIGSSEFETKLHGLIEANPALATDLDVEMRSGVTVA